jgi:hypothetical protein
MKTMLCLFCLLLASFVSFAQEQPPPPAPTEISFNCDKPEKSGPKTFSPGANVVIKFSGSAENLKGYFKNTRFKDSENEETLFGMLKPIPINKKLTNEDNYFKDSSKTENGKAQLGITITQDVYANDSSFSILFSKDGKSFDTVGVSVNELNNNTVTTDVADPVIIDDIMLAGISEGGCQLCDLYNTRVKVPNNSKHDRIYSTDYIITYDPLLKKDAYTICKHVFEKKDNILYERYIKIAPMWFAPHVGSQIRFEVINQPLDKPLRLSVNEEDVFNSGATQFAALISGLVNSNIINPVLGDTVVKGASSKEQMADTSKDISQKLDAVIPQIAKYISAFKISSCAIQQHNVNLPKIIAGVSDYLGLGLGSATLDQLSAGLKKKINDEEKDSGKKAIAIEKVGNIIAALKALENVQPLAYTTLRAKNRDYIEIKYTDANNVESKPENIRMSGGMKIDFSGGFVLTGLRDYSYALKDAVVQYTPAGASALRDTTGNVIIKEDEGKNQVGVGMLSHFYPRISSHYNIGGTVGLMTSTNLNLRIMLGGSVMISSLFGSNNRISFSGGVVWGKVNRLSVQNEDYLDHPRFVNGQPQFYSQASAPQPVSRSDHSWFFAITMNFGGN